MESEGGNDLAFTLAYPKEVDILIVAAPNKNIVKMGWVKDENTDVTVYVKNKNCGVRSIRTYRGFLIINCENCAITACHISANIKVEGFKRTMEGGFNE